MDFSYSGKVIALRDRVDAFMRAVILPAETEYREEVEANRRAGHPWQPTRTMERLKEKARAEKLWNLFLPASEHGAGLTNLEYAPICELMGHSPIASEAFNCS